MPLKNVPKNKCVSFAHAWGGEESHSPTVLEVALLQSFPNHQFKLYVGTRREEMIASVKEFGVLMPLIVWKTQEGEHFILSGHNRKEAAVAAGLTQVPVVLRDNLTMEEATLIVTETNLRQRSFGDMSYSERAICLKQHYDATKQQGKRRDLLESFEGVWNGSKEEVEEDGCSLRERLAKESEISSATFARYVKIASLHPDLLEHLDQGLISFLAAYQLSFVEEEALQESLAQWISEGQKLSQAQAKTLRNLFEEGGDIGLEAFFSVDTLKDTAEKPRKIPLSPTLLHTYFKPEQSKEEIETILEEALQLYFSSEKRKDL